MQILTGRATGLESSMRLPDWPEEGTDSSLRDSQEEYPSVPASSIAGQRSATDAPARTASPVVLTPTGRESPGLQGGGSRLGQWKSLDEFYDESDSDEEEEDEDGDEDEETEDEVRRITEVRTAPEQRQNTVEEDPSSNASSEEEIESSNEEDESSSDGLPPRDN